MAIINKKLPWSGEGFNIRRNNPDGTPAVPSRILGFSGTVDLSGFGTSAELVIKIDAGAEETNSIDWTTAVDPTAVTVAEFVSFFNLAGFTDILASIDSVTGALLLTYVGSGTPLYVQVYDGVDEGFAAALDFGQGQKFGGKGIKFNSNFNNVNSITFPMEVKDKEKIETESLNGTLSEIVIEAIAKGMNPVITVSDIDFNLKQLIQGGIYDEANNHYSDPSTDQTTKPLVAIEVFLPLYAKASQNREDHQGYIRIVFYSCSGIEGDSTAELKAWGATVYNMTVTEWTDENGVKHPFRERFTISIAEYDTLDVANV